MSSRSASVLALALAASVGGVAAARGVTPDPRIVHSQGLATKKGSRTPVSTWPIPAPLVGTLLQTHSAERVPLDADAPSPARLDVLLADSVTGAAHPIDPRLLALVRALSTHYRSPSGGAPSIELVSGFRTPKLNEMRRKKGHHVASHSQHSLGNALDFRIVRDGEARGVDPRQLAKAIGDEKWKGGVGIYVLPDDWFVHADVGPARSWYSAGR